MPLGLSIPFRRRAGSGLLSPLFRDVSSILDGAGATYDRKCLKLALNDIYQGDAFSPYILFRHVYDTIELDGYAVDRFCLQKEAISISDPSLFDIDYAQGTARAEADLYINGNVGEGGSLECFAESLQALMDIAVPGFEEAQAYDNAARIAGGSGGSIYCNEQFYALLETI